MKRMRKVVLSLLFAALAVLAVGPGVASAAGPASVSTNAMVHPDTRCC